MSDKQHKEILKNALISMLDAISSDNIELSALGRQLKQTDIQIPENKQNREKLAFLIAAIFGNVSSLRTRDNKNLLEILANSTDLSSALENPTKKPGKTQS